MRVAYICHWLVTLMMHNMCCKSLYFLCRTMWEIRQIVWAPDDFISPAQHTVKISPSFHTISSSQCTSQGSNKDTKLHLYLNQQKVSFQYVWNRSNMSLLFGYTYNYFWLCLTPLGNQACCPKYTKPRQLHSRKKCTPLGHHMPVGQTLILQG